MLKEATNAIRKMFVYLNPNIASILNLIFSTTRIHVTLYVLPTNSPSIHSQSITIIRVHIYGNGKNDFDPLIKVQLV